MSILGVVFLYFPNIDQFISNINCYIGNIDKLIIWQNSSIDVHTKDLIRQKTNAKKIVFRGNGENIGLPIAINNVLSEFGNSYEYLLTMDQDSRWLNFEEYMKAIEENKDKNQRIGIYGPQIITKYSCPNSASEDIVDHVITSGAMYRIEIFRKIGGFREDYFIDALDEEICLRARKNKIETLKVNKGVLFQEFGDTVEKTFFGKKFFYMKHSSFRNYYIVRNHIYLLKEYNMNFEKKNQIIQSYIIRQAIKILLFDESKLSKLNNIYKGIIDGIKFKKKKSNIKFPL
ncbi:hypothetical protein [Desemzia sp. FAM 24101]|uniref:hypothetical protein n=1 Tax=Desemzia sp. FAM 24101 TaxID=3259522 RepID=UPI003886F07B